MAYREVALARVFVVLADSLRPDLGIIDTMDGLVTASTEFTSAAEAGAVIAGGSNRLHVVASTSERTTDIEEVQVGANAGPCLDCFLSGEPVDVPNIAEAHERWPRFAAAAADRGFVAAHALPLRNGTKVVGSLNIFSTTTGGLDPDELALLQAFADVASTNCLQRQAALKQEATSSDLQHALDSRVLIEQAKGVIAQRNGVGIDEAFRALRAHARSRGARLHDIAGLVVSRELTI